MLHFATRRRESFISVNIYTRWFHGHAYLYGGRGHAILRLVYRAHLVPASTGRRAARRISPETLFRKPPLRVAAISRDMARDETGDYFAATFH